MTNEEAIKILQNDGCCQDCTFGGYPCKLVGCETHQAIGLAIKALGHEVYWEDVKQALNGWLNNTTSPNTALNDIYRAYMGKGETK